MIARRALSSKASTRYHVRFAPSPTGTLHIGGLRVALFNYLLARQSGGTFTLRIDDTDQSRNVQGSEDAIVEALTWAGIKPDRGPTFGGFPEPLRQSERLHLYRSFLDRLIEDGKAYPCFCTPEQLDTRRLKLEKSGASVEETRTYDGHCFRHHGADGKAKMESGHPYVVRFRCPEEEEVRYTDLVYGESSTTFTKHAATHKNTSNTDTTTYLPDDFILLKSTGIPTYHFASTLDDHLLGITHVLRGEEWRQWTSRHILLQRALNLSSPTYAHLPIMVRSDGKKISKRDGDGDVRSLIEFEPEAVLNWLILMGWGRSKEKGSDFMTIPEMVSEFDLENVNKRRAVKDDKKLVWLNKQHLWLKAHGRLQNQVVQSDDSPEHKFQKSSDLVTRILPELKAKYPDSEIWSVDEPSSLVLSMTRSVIGNVDKLSDVPNLLSYFFIRPTYTSPESLEFGRSAAPHIYHKCLVLSLRYLQSADISHPGHEDVKAIQNSIKESLGDDFKSYKKVVNVPLRHALTGRKVGASLGDILNILGRQEVMERIKTALEWCAQDQGTEKGNQEIS